MPWISGSFKIVFVMHLYLYSVQIHSDSLRNKKYHLNSLMNVNKLEKTLDEVFSGNQPHQV
jgi:hypothetical protein